MKTQRKISLQIILFLVCGGLMAQVNISGVINSYYQVTGLGVQSVQVKDPNGLNRCDKVLLIQMKGASINTPNNATYGSVTNYNEAGNYEFLIVSNIVGNTVSFTTPLALPYNITGIVQLVKVPVYTNVNVNAPLTCNNWNGTTGGVLAFEACEVSLNSNIDVSGRGFRGGNVNNGTGAYTSIISPNYVLPSTSPFVAEKGEGIFVSNLTNNKGMGCNANGGGGGNNINGGGAGGSNCGAGGAGGNVYTSASNPPYTNAASGGVGGNPLPYSNATNKIFLGGGGGAGHENDAVGTSGGNGGAIVIIRARTIFGNGFNILSNGITALSTTIDGQGGGGAGGTVLLDIGLYANSFLVSVAGGNGGSDNYSGPDCHGKGGGGGGGIVWSAASLFPNVTTNISGGVQGFFTSPTSGCYNMNKGEAPGANGCRLEKLVIKHPQPCASTCFTASINKTSSLKTSSSTLTNLDLKVFPNPSNGHIIIEGLNTEVSTTLLITDITGKVIISKTITSTNGTYNLDLPNTQTTYFMELKTGKDTILHKKLIIMN